MRPAAGAAGSGRQVAVLVAADAGQRLARLDVGQRPHRLQRQPVGVQGLEEHRHAGRHPEVGGTVGLHGHRAQHELAGVLRSRRPGRAVHVRLHLGRHADDPQPLHRCRGPRRPARDRRPAPGIWPSGAPSHRTISASTGGRGRGRTGIGETLEICRVAMQQRQVAEGVVQIDAQRVGRDCCGSSAGISVCGGSWRSDQATRKCSSRQRPGIGVVAIPASLPSPGNRPPASAASAAARTRAPRAIQQRQRPAGDRMMRGGDEDQLVEPGTERASNTHCGRTV